MPSHTHYLYIYIYTYLSIYFYHTLAPGLVGHMVETFGDLLEIVGMVSWPLETYWLAAVYCSYMWQFPED